MMVQFSFLASVLLAASGGFIGDGLPSGDGADWYVQPPASVFRAEYVLPEGADGAVLDIACLGYYGVVDGAGPVAAFGSFAPMPLWTPFDGTVLEDRVKLAAKPYPATNEVRIVLGNGFYNLPPLRFWGSIDFRAHLAHGRPCFRARLNGAELEWKWRPTNILANSPYLGTTVDARLAAEGGDEWRPAVAMAGAKGEIVPRRAPPVKVIRELRGSARWLEEGRRQIIDFGENVTGMGEFVLSAPAGTEVEFVYGELLDADGSVNAWTQSAGQIKMPGRGGPGAPDLACQRDVYIAAGRDGERAAFPFAWHIGRYVEVKGCPTLVREAVWKAISSDVADREPGRGYRSAREEFNRLHELCRRTFRNNLIGVQSDCPGRERLGYGGDIVATCEAYMLNWDMREFYLKTLRDFADEAAVDGWITETAPFTGIASSGVDNRADRSLRAGPISWALAVPVLMDALIRHHPDVADRALAFYPVCARYVRLVAERHPAGFIPRCIGDHEALERAPNEVTATAHWHEFVRLTAKFAERLGRDGDAAEFGKLAARIAAVFAERYVKDGRVADGSQSAQAIALYLGLVPAEQVEAAEKALVDAVEKAGTAPTTGIFATRYLLMYLSEHGRRDLAERIVLHRGFPGWMDMVDSGITTLWETWRHSVDVYSNCHPMFGSVDEWLLRWAHR